MCDIYENDESGVIHLKDVEPKVRATGQTKDKQFQVGQ